ncbi:MAG: hypothetical protein JKY61_12715 [Planctomycetes bacterium]|nr:hypothetical protein [Planctomycetota bacterium]
MNLPYRIVWVDDTETWFDSVRTEVEEFIEGIEYGPSITYFDSIDEAKEAVCSPELDLLVVDYNLEEGKDGKGGRTGDELIALARAGGVFSEVVFYSQRQEKLPQLGGVFSCSRENAIETIQIAISRSVHKLQDKGVVRGLLITSAIDLELMIERLILGRFDGFAPVIKSRLFDSRILSFEPKVLLLKKLLMEDCVSAEGDRKEAMEGILSIHTGFIEEVCTPRNLLAHAKAIETDGRTVLKGLKGKGATEFNDDWISGLRGNLAKQEVNLRNLTVLWGLEEEG